MYRHPSNCFQGHPEAFSDKKKISRGVRPLSEENDTPTDQTRPMSYPEPSTAHQRPRQTDTWLRSTPASRPKSAQFGPSKVLPASPSKMQLQMNQSRELRMLIRLVVKLEACSVVGQIITDPGRRSAIGLSPFLAPRWSNFNKQRFCRHLHSISSPSQPLSKLGVAHTAGALRPTVRHTGAAGGPAAQIATTCNSCCTHPISTKPLLLLLSI